MTDADAARHSLEATNAQATFCGHTHVPAIYRTVGFSVRDVTPFELDIPAVAVVPWPQKGRVLINVGSVGQPRDGDPRAAFGVLDEGTGTIEMRRVEYDVAGAQRRIIEAGLPVFLAERLETGF